MEKEQKREFTGVWIPRRIIEDEELSMTDRMIYAEIACFEVCYKSNKTLGERYGLKANTISIVISKLITKGYIESNNKTGEYRQLYVVLNQRASLKKIKEPLSEKSKSLFEKNHTIDNSIDNNKNTIMVENKFSTPYHSFKAESNSNQKTPRQWTNTRRAELGKPPLRTPRTEKQDKAFEALKLKDYFRDKGYEQHGMQFFLVKNNKREATVTKLIVEAHKTLGSRGKELIDWWFKGAGEWCGYEPEQCFMGKTIEKFLNKDKTNKPTDPMVQVFIKNI